MSFMAVKKVELKQMILDKGYLEQSDVLDTMSKTDMISLIKSKMEEEVVATAPVETPKETSGFLATEDTEKVAEKVAPATKGVSAVAETMSVNHPDWTNFVKEQLTEKEKIDGFPSTDGLRRIFEVLIGEIVSVKVESIQSPKQDNSGRATVKVIVSYVPYGQYTSSVYNGVKIIEDIADCSILNTAAPYYNHASATAMTMAEGRCYKKGLRLRTHTKEEMSGPQGADAEIAAQLERIENPAAANQKLVIANLCKKNGINLVKFLNSFKDIKEHSIDLITSTEAHALINQLNKYQKAISDGGERVPEEILEDE